MGQFCTSQRRPREWKVEEINAYLDWEKIMEERVEEQVRVEFEATGTVNSRRGTKHIWDDLDTGYLACFK